MARSPGGGRSLDPQAITSVTLVLELQFYLGARSSVLTLASELHLGRGGVSGVRDGHRAGVEPATERWGTA